MIATIKAQSAITFATMPIQTSGFLCHGLLASAAIFFSASALSIFGAINPILVFSMLDIPNYITFNFLDYLSPPLLS